MLIRLYILLLILNFVNGGNRVLLERRELALPADISINVQTSKTSGLKFSYQVYRVPTPRKHGRIYYLVTKSSEDLTAEDVRNAKDAVDENCYGSQPLNDTKLHLITLKCEFVAKHFYYLFVATDADGNGAHEFQYIPGGLMAFVPLTSPPSRASTTPTFHPSFYPSVQPSPQPTLVPTSRPSRHKQTRFPTTHKRTRFPTVSHPTFFPSAYPKTSKPTFEPSISPPTFMPTINPTALSAGNDNHNNNNNNNNGGTGGNNNGNPGTDGNGGTNNGNGGNNNNGNGENNNENGNGGNNNGNENGGNNNGNENGGNNNENENGGNNNGNGNENEIDTGNNNNKETDVEETSNLRGQRSSDPLTHHWWFWICVFLVLLLFCFFCFLVSSLCGSGKTKKNQNSMREILVENIDEEDTAPQGKIETIPLRKIENEEEQKEEERLLTDAKNEILAQKSRIVSASATPDTAVQRMMEHLDNYCDGWMARERSLSRRPSDKINNLKNEMKPVFIIACKLSEMLHAAKAHTIEKAEVIVAESASASQCVNRMRLEVDSFTTDYMAKDDFWTSVPLDVIEKSKDKIAETFFHHSRSKSFDRGYQDEEERKDEDQIITPQQASRRQQKRRPGRRQQPTHERNYKSNQRRKNKPFVEPHYGSDSPV